jgi:uncharacterized cupredoxin-like copper-binding protein
MFFTVLALALIQGPFPSAASPSRPEAPRPTVVRVTASDFEFDVPSTVPAGDVTFRLLNHGPDFHHIQIVRVPAGMDRSGLRRALQARDPEAEGLVFLGGPGTVISGDSVDALVRMEPGEYGLVCFVEGTDRVEHYKKGMIARFTVTGTAESVAPVTADIEITLRDYEFAFSTPATPGRRTLRIVNEAKQPHEMFLARMAPGQKAQDLLQWIADGAKGPPPAYPLGGVLSLSNGQSNHFTVDFTPGAYALICFVPDAADGRPHFLHGMVTDFVVP